MATDNYRIGDASTRAMRADRRPLTPAEAERLLRDPAVEGYAGTASGEVVRLGRKIARQPLRGPAEGWLYDSVRVAKSEFARLTQED